MTAALSLVMGASVAPAGGGAAMTPFLETWPGAASAALPAPWIQINGAPVQSGVGGVLMDHGTTEAFGRSDPGTTGVITYSSVVDDGHWPFIFWSADATLTNYVFVILRQDTHRLQYQEWNSGVGSNTTNGTFALAGGGTNFFDIRITRAGASVTIAIRDHAIGGAFTDDIIVTQGTLLSQSYLGAAIAVASGSTGQTVGQMQVA